MIKLLQNDLLVVEVFNMLPKWIGEEEEKKRVLNTGKITALSKLWLVHTLKKYKTIHAKYNPTKIHLNGRLMYHTIHTKFL